VCLFISMNMNLSGKVLNTGSFYSLCPDITRLISEFLNANDLIKFSNVCRMVRHDLHGFFDITLSEKNSYKFCQDNNGNFACRARELTKRGKLRLSSHNYTILDNINGLLNGVTSMDLSGCSEIDDVSALSGVRVLDLSGCFKITDVSALGGVHTLDLSDCGAITDVSALGGIHTLDLSDCYGVTNVSNLGYIHNLNLHRCTGVTDVGELDNVYNLNLYKCSGVTSVSGVYLCQRFSANTFGMLSDVYTSTLCCCNSVTNILGGVHTFFWCTVIVLATLMCLYIHC
jgi:hypothetical protein